MMKRSGWLFTLGLVIALCLVAPNIGGCGNTADSNSTTSSSSTSTSTSSTTTTLNPRLKWVYSLGPTYYSSPAIGSDGTIYIGTSYWAMYAGVAPEYGLYAINPDGTLKWKYTTGDTGPIRGSPAIASDGTIYFVVQRDSTTEATKSSVEDLYAITSDGNFKWNRRVAADPLPGIGCLTPALGSDGTIYVNGDGIRSFGPDGNLKWTYGFYNAQSSPVVGRSGTIYSVYKANDGVDGICALNPDGTLKWQYPRIGSWMISSPALGTNETVYIGTSQFDPLGVYFIAISSAGSLEWSYKAKDAGDIRCSAAVGGDGTIYFGTTHADHNYIFALNPDGTLKWEYDTHQDVQGPWGHDLYASPAIDSDGTIYFASEFGYIYALNPDGTMKWKDSSIGNAYGTYVWTSPAIGGDGTLYLGGIYGNALKAIITGSTGLSTTAAWPKFHYDNKNTGGVSP